MNSDSSDLWTIEAWTEPYQILKVVPLYFTKKYSNFSLSCSMASVLCIAIFLNRGLWIDRWIVAQILPKTFVSPWHRAFIKMIISVCTHNRVKVAWWCDYFVCLRLGKSPFLSVTRGCDFTTRIKDLFDVCLNRAEFLLNKKSGQVSLIQTAGLEIKKTLRSHSDEKRNFLRKTE